MDEKTIDITLDADEALGLSLQAEEIHLFLEEYCSLLVARALETEEAALSLTP